MAANNTEVRREVVALLYFCHLQHAEHQGRTPIHNMLEFSGFEGGVVCFQFSPWALFPQCLLQPHATLPELLCVQYFMHRAQPPVAAACIVLQRLSQPIHVLCASTSLPCAACSC